MLPPRFRSRLRALIAGDRGAVALLVTVFFAANWPLLANHVSERGDGESFFAPFYNYLAILARSGHLLWWNPYCNGGSPDFAEPQVGAFSPVTLLFGLLAGPGPTGFHLYWLCVWLFGGLGMYVLARALSAPPWGALVTSLALVLSGFYIGHAEHLSAVYTFSFVPWILWRLRASLISARLWPACEAGALWGLSALAGNPAVHIPAAMFLALAALAWVPPPIPGASRWQPWRAYLLAMTLLAVVGVIVLAPTYLSFRYEAAGYSHRAIPLVRSVVLDQKFGWAWLTALASPAFVPINGVPAWAEFDVSMREIYLGAAVPVLALLTVWQGRADWRVWVILLAGLFFLGVAMGSLLPLRAWLYDWVPVTRYFRHAPMFRGFFVLALAMLAAPATRRIDSCRLAADSPADIRRQFAIVAGCCALAGVGAFVWIDATLSDEAAARLSALAPVHAALVWVGLAALALAGARWTGFRRFLPGGLAFLTVLDLTGAYFLARNVAYQDKPAAAAGGTVRSADVGAAEFARTIVARNNANLYARHPVFVSYTAMRNTMQENWGLDRVLRPYVLGPQRIWFAADVPSVPATLEVYEAFVQHAHAINALPIVRQERAALLQPGSGLPAGTLAAIASAPVARPVPCQVLTSRDNDLSVRVECPTDGYALVTDRWSRSWRATVNGQPVPVDGGDFLFRLIPVKAGDNVIAMHFAIESVYPLLALSWVTLGFVAATALWKWRRRAQRSARETIPPPPTATPVQLPAAVPAASITYA